MPPAPSPGLHERQTRSRSTDRAAKVRFRRAVTLMVMTLLVPGSAQLIAGRKDVGRIAIRVWAVLLVGAVLALLLGLVWQGFAFWAVSNTMVLGLVRILLMAVAIGWGFLLVDAWRLGQPLSLRQNQRLAVLGLNGLLCFTVAGSLLFASHVVGVQRDFIAAMFGEGQATKASEGRYNVLLMGGDAGAGRWGLRPDSLNVASIDAETGKTVLFGLPRNMANFTFPEGSVMAEQFPDGFDCDECYLNGLSTWAQDNEELFVGTEGEDNPGVAATVEGVEGITGLEINYWAMVNLEGFKDLVDAIGGVTLNVRDRIPVGGLGSDVTGYIEPGKRTLSGFETLWFDRAREGSDDYSRMARQKCVMNAMVTQVSPEVAVRNFEEIAKASESMVSTNLPASELDTFMALALEAKSQKISTLSFVPPMVNTAEPDIADLHERVQGAIDRTEGDVTAPEPGAKRKKQASGMTGGSIGSLGEGYAANDSSDLAAAC